MQTAATIPTWFSMPDAMQLIIMLLFGAFIWFALRTLQTIDKNQCSLFKRMSEAEKTIASMQGRCDATHRHNRRDGDMS